MGQFVRMAAAVLGCALAGRAEEWRAIPEPKVTGSVDMRALAGAGCEILKGFSGKTDESKWGVLTTREVTLPAFSRGLFFAHATKAKAWPNMRNQAYPYILADDAKSRADLRDGAGFFLLELKGGGYLAVTAMPGPLTESWFHSDKQGRVLLSAGTFGTGGVERADVPLFAWARSDDLYEACAKALTSAITSKPIQGWTRPRSEKEYPEYLKYLGWCSWEHFKGKIDEQNMLQALKEIDQSALPVRYTIIDMGHTSVYKGGLNTFKPIADKFPNGWAPLLKLRTADKIKWMGLWHFFQGAQDGISPVNDFSQELNAQFAATGNKSTVAPRNDPKASLAFYQAFMGSVKTYGFDFVKVDFQSAQLSRLAGQVKNAAEMCVNNAQGFEQALHELNLGLINCNWHNPLNFFNCRFSNVGRCSMDYVANSTFSARRHLFQSYANTLWMGQLVWPDHDMFHSSDKMAGRMMAVSKAMSGGPVYLSDAPLHFDSKTIMPLCYQDGELLRPLAPAAPLPDSVFVDAFRDAVPYRVIAPLPGGAAAVAVYSLKDEKQAEPVGAKVTAEDYRCAGAMEQPYTGKRALPAEGLILYDTLTGKGLKLEKEYAFELKGLADRLVQLSPIVKGWSVIGRSDKYLSAAAVEVVAATESELKIRMAESGPLAVWSGSRAPRAEGVTWVDAGDGLYKADIPVGKRDRVILISR